MIPGDWVQAAERITEENFQGEALFEHARLRDIGHVMDVYGDGFAYVYWERTGTSVDVAFERLIWLCHWDAGKHP